MIIYTIELEGNFITFVGETDTTEEGKKRSHRKSSVKEITTYLGDDYITIVSTDDATTNYDYTEIEDPSTPGIAFLSVTLFRTYLVTNLEITGGIGALTNGNGTTANGSAADLGGTLTGETDLNLDNNEFSISSSIGFDIGTGANGAVHFQTVQSDGKIIIGGEFTTYNSVSVGYITRLNIDGSIDSTFVTGTGFNGPLFDATLQPDGKIIVVGDYLLYNGTPRIRVARLNTDGSLDTSFNVGTGANIIVNTVALQDNGFIIVGGEFTTFNGTSLNRLVRVSSTGVIDVTLDIGTGFNTGAVEDIVVQDDGNILVAGSWTTYNGSVTTKIMRMSTLGVKDATYMTGHAGPSLAVRAIALQSDGKAVIVGSFTNFATSRNNIARLLTTGNIDATFNVGTGLNTSAYSLDIQTDGKIVIGGDFATYNGNASNKIVRVATDGTWDAAFTQGTSFNFLVLRVTSQSDGNTVVGGNFTSFNGTAINRVLKLNSDGSIVTPAVKVIFGATGPYLAADYSANYTARSLIDKAYADSYFTGALTDGAPTSAEIIVILGSAASRGAGYQASIKDTDGSGLIYKIICDGTNYYYINGVLAL